MIAPRVPVMAALVTRLRDASHRLERGLPTVDPDGLAWLLARSAELLAEAEEDVQLVWALETQTGETMRRIPGAMDRKLEERLRQLRKGDG
jgi:hypothetical protein